MVLREGCDSHVLVGRCSMGSGGALGHVCPASCCFESFLFFLLGWKFNFLKGFFFFFFAMKQWEMLK